MNFGLNKIDTDLRRKVNEKTKDGKVHKTEAINIKAEREKREDKTFKRYIENSEILSKNKSRKKEGRNDNTIEVSGEVKINSVDGISGTFLDIRK